MKSIQIDYTTKDEDGNDVSGSVSYNAPETFSEAEVTYGEHVGLSKMLASIKIDIQRICRKAKTPEEAQLLTNNYTPGLSAAKTHGGMSVKALKDAFSLLSESDAADVVAEIKARAGKDKN